jgi:hypothetical protein
MENLHFLPFQKFHQNAKQGLFSVREEVGNRFENVWVVGG